MFEIETINAIKENFGVFFDKMIVDIAEDDNISLREFEYRKKCIEVMRENLDETFDYLGCMIVNRNREKGI